jgi:hypothetical protein
MACARLAGAYHPETDGPDFRVEACAAVIAGPRARARDVTGRVSAGRAVAAAGGK